MMSGIYSYCLANEIRNICFEVQCSVFCNMIIYFTERAPLDFVCSKCEFNHLPSTYQYFKWPCNCLHHNL
jgi:hypothetical protein